MKNKAFTLVELIAVVVVIGIISAISLISYNAVQKNVHEKVFLSYEKGMKVAVQQLIIDQPELLGVSVPLSYLTSQDSGGISFPVPEEPYLELINNPDDDSDFCLNGSYAKAELDGNKTVFEICLKCNTYQSSTCGEG